MDKHRNQCNEVGSMWKGGKENEGKSLLMYLPVGDYSINNFNKSILMTSNSPIDIYLFEIKKETFKMKRVSKAIVNTAVRITGPNGSSHLSESRVRIFSARIK
mmetsp:Transcript_30610/g.33444  ORF Transcript_30610/g.33444 Transcript_30610/m.33444 type:complete len:103 (+) Transcript_30610:93-401(+)